jgi:hypothetical protein
MTILNDTRLDDLKKEAGKLGRALGKSAGNRDELGIKVALGVRDGFVDLSPKSKDVEDLYKEFSEYVKSSKDEFGVNKDVGEILKDNSFGAQVSKLKSIAKLGMHPAVGDKCDEFLQGVRKIHAEEGVKGSTYESMIKVARAQAKSENELDDTIIRSILTPGEKEQKDKLDRVKALVKKLKSELEGNPEKGIEGIEELQPVYDVAAAVETALAFRAQEEAYLAAKAAREATHADGTPVSADILQLEVVA